MAGASMNWFTHKEFPMKLSYGSIIILSISFELKMIVERNWRRIIINGILINFPPSNNFQNTHLSEWNHDICQDVFGNLLFVHGPSHGLQRLFTAVWSTGHDLTQWPPSTNKCSVKNTEIHQNCRLDLCLFWQLLWK